MCRLSAIYFFAHLYQLSVALVFRVFLAAGVCKKLVMRWYSSNSHATRSASFVIQLLDTQIHHNLYQGLTAGLGFVGSTGTSL